MTLLLFIVVLALLIFVHEAGHFLAAKWARIRVDEFGLGFPPRAIGFKPKKSETTYSLNWIPFGGFVKIFGENPTEVAEQGEDRSRSLVAKSHLTQIWVLAAGVIFNVLFAWLLLSAGLMGGLPAAVEPNGAGVVGHPDLTVLAVIPNSPAERAGLMSDDIILYAEWGDAVLQGDTLTSTAFQDLVDQSAGEEVSLFIRRAEENFVLSLSGEESIVENGHALGISIANLATVQFTNPLRALFEGAVRTGELLGAVTVGLGQFLGSALIGQADFSQVAGPVGIVGLVGDAAERGFANVLVFTVFISLNLAVINLIPFPALDGGRILFIIIEKLKGSPIRPRVAHIANLIGFGLLIALLLVVTYNDIVRLVVQ